MRKKKKIFVLILIKRQPMKMYVEIEVWVHVFLTWSPDESGQLHIPAALPPGKSPRYLLDKRLGGPQKQSERDAEETNLRPCRESNPGFQPVANHYTD
jgi:hypothetical protein